MRLALLGLPLRGVKTGTERVVMFPRALYNLSATYRRNQNG